MVELGLRFLCAIWFLGFKERRRERQVLEFCEGFHAWESVCALFSQLLAAWVEQPV